VVRIGYFGPEGTFTEEALNAATDGLKLRTVPFPTIYDTVMGVRDRVVELALVPIENSLEGSVNPTLDALAIDTEEVALVGELVHPIEHCLMARRQLELDAVEVVISHPQVLGQCARFIRTHLPAAQIVPGSSSAESARQVAAEERPWAAVGNRLAAELYGCVLLRCGVEDVAGNETRFVWLARGGGAVQVPGRVPRPGPCKTAIVFWGLGSETPGWLVRCLSEFAQRDVNLTRIESRPRRQGLGRYMFFADLDGGETEPQVAQALHGLRRHVEALRVLGSFPVAD